MKLALDRGPDCASHDDNGMSRRQFAPPWTPQALDAWAKTQRVAASDRESPYGITLGAIYFPSKWIRQAKDQELGKRDVLAIISSIRSARHSEVI